MTRKLVLASHVCLGPAQSMSKLALKSSRRWYAVQTQPRREALARLHLERQGFASFCPLRRKIRRSGNRHVEEMAPLFPGYLFVALDLANDQWRSVNGTIGVMRLVAFGAGGSPAPLVPGFVEHLAKLGDMGGGFGDGLKKGDRIRIMGGPFDELCGILESASDQERVTVLLSLLGKDTRVHMRRDLLIAA